MTKAAALFEAGRLSEAVEVLGSELRQHPTDSQRRTFLFELLCFSGEWDRAEKHLELLVEGDSKKQMGALLYKAALHADRTRHEIFETKSFPASDAPEVGGVVNGSAVQRIADADPRLGARLEVLAGGNYLWIPFEQISIVKIEPPKRLRDLLWTPAVVRTKENYKGQDLGEVLIPVISPFSSRQTDDSVRLGRQTIWEPDEEFGEVPYGQKMLLVGDEEIPILEIREIEILARA